MNVVAGHQGCSAGDILRALRSRTPAFPFEELTLHPVSAIEHVAVNTAALPRGVCAVGCLGCCAAAVPATIPAERLTRLNPPLLSRILLLAEELAREHVHILSRVRLVLYNGSNELDNPDCIPLRQILSGFLERTYGFPLGAVSSDLVFHISGSPVLEWNLARLLEMPRLWDNICLSIDEQIPMRGEADYTTYLERLRGVWTVLRPALTCSLGHARVTRVRAPRVVINMLVPQEGARFRKEHQSLYPGGPLRAVHFEELVDRYIRPFVGSLIETTAGLPLGHKFTSGTARLSDIPGSSVYVGYNHYITAGRGAALVCDANGARKIAPSAINTKIYPAGEERFRFKACFTTAPFVDDEIPVPTDHQPRWFRTLNSLVIDVGQLHASGHATGVVAVRCQ